MQSDKPVIFIVEDDEEISELLKENLSLYGFSVWTFQNGATFFDALMQHAPDLIILDIMLPGENGLSICKRLRAPGSSMEFVPLIFLTALGDLTDRVVGLELGADDYLAKPFEMRELVARIRALLRRSGHKEPNNSANTANNLLNSLSHQIWRFGGWKIDIGARQLIDDKDVTVSLSSNEFKLLMLFLSNPQRVLTRESILNHLGSRMDNYDRSIDVQISRLRSKLRDNAKNPSIIRTMRGDGYMLSVTVQKTSL